MFDAIAHLVHRRARRIVIVASLLFAGAGVLGSSVADRLDPYGAEDPATDAIKANAVLERSTGVQPGAGLLVLIELPDRVGSAAARAKVAPIASTVRGDPAIGGVFGYGETRNPALVSRDRRSTYLVANFKRGVTDKQRHRSAKRLGRAFAPVGGVKIGGRSMAENEVNETVESDLRRAELYAFPILFLLSFWFFRSLVAAALPPLIGGLAIVGTFVALRAASEMTSVSIFALNLVTGLGLGLAIDYSLFMVSRYREEIARSGPGLQALRRTMATAGRTVFFSSLTVAVAMASLLVFPQRFLYSMGLGGALVTLIACVVALLVLPAVLALLGERVNALAPKRLQRAGERDARPASAGGWYRLSRFVMRRPGRIAAASAAVLIVLGLPFLGIKFTSVDPTVLPTEASARQVHDTLASEFRSDQTSPIYLAVRAAPGREVAAFTRRLGKLPNVAAVGPPRRLGPKLMRIDVFSDHTALAERSQDLVRDIRAVKTPFRVLAGGETARFVDQKSSLGRHLPIAFAIIVVATIAILFLMTGSVVLPIKALVMNVLGLSAAFGILVLIFQDGRLQGLLDYTSQGALESSQPVLLFAVAFGLSTDYGVFLLSRIKEARDGGASDSEAVAIGLERTGRIVTAAALLFCVAIGAIATSKIIFIKEVGVGTALAVLIDATLVRALLVPALMELLGRRNWWAPAPLRRLHRRFGLNES